MIILIVKGGLGNQLFQLLAALYFSKNHGNLHIHIYTNNLTNFQVPRSFCLKPFLNDLDIRIQVMHSNLFVFYRYLLVIFHKLKLFTITDSTYNTNHYLGFFFNLYILDGYFQTSFFINRENLLLLRKSLLKSVDIYKTILPLTNQSINLDHNIFFNCLGIHIRGTDRKNESFNTDLSKYVNAILSKNDKYVFCFTDDKGFAEKVLYDINLPKIYSSSFNLSDLDEFALIGKFERFLVTNSTFSIFARFLSERKHLTFAIAEHFSIFGSNLLELLMIECNTVVLNSTLTD